MASKAQVLALLPATALNVAAQLGRTPNQVHALLCHYERDGDVRRTDKLVANGTEGQGPKFSKLWERTNEAPLPSRPKSRYEPIYNTLDALEIGDTWEFKAEQIGPHPAAIAPGYQRTAGRRLYMHRTSRGFLYVRLE